MADTYLRGTISVMTGSDPSSGDPIYKGLYPKTITDQVVNLDTYVTSAIETAINAIPNADNLGNKGLVSIGANLTNNAGQISLTQENIINALGYNPQSQAGTIENAVNAQTANILAANNSIDGVAFNGSVSVNHYGICSTESSNSVKSVSCPNFVLVQGARIIVNFTVTNTVDNPQLNVNSTGAKPIHYRNAVINRDVLTANHTYEFVYNGSAYDIIGDLDTDTNTNAVTGIKGSNESTYRTGNVEITATMIGLGNVNNTSDSMKHVASAARLTAPINISITDNTYTGVSTSFDGSSNISLKLPETIKANIEGNSSTANKLKATTYINGISFDGSTNVTNYAICSNASDVVEKTAVLDSFNLITGANLIVKFVNANTVNNPTLNVNGKGSIPLYYKGLPVGTDLIKANQAYLLVYNGSQFEIVGGAGSSTTIINDEVATLESPNFTGVATVPNPVADSDNNQIATTHFVKESINTFADMNVEVVQTIHQIKDAINEEGTVEAAINSAITQKQNRHDALTSISNLNTQANQLIYTINKNAYATTSLTSFARTILDDTSSDEVRNTIGALGKTEQAQSAAVADRANKDNNGDVITTTYAKVDSPTLFGTPTAPTAPLGTNTKQLATTAFVKNEINNVLDVDSDIIQTIKDIDTAIKNEETVEAAINNAITQKQTKSDVLTSIGNLQVNADHLLYSTDINDFRATPLTSFARTILDDTSAESVRETIDALGKTEKAVSSELADTATKAINDNDGNNIVATYHKFVIPKQVEILQNQWIEDTNNATYPYYYRITDPTVNANDIAELIIQNADSSLKMRPYTQTSDNTIELRAVELPENNLYGQYFILKGKTA